jgi:hypothetical protein
MKHAFAAAVVVFCSCAPMKLQVKSDTIAPTAAPPVATYLEPFTETAELEMRSTSSGNTTMYYKDKPFYALPSTLADLYTRAKKKMDGSALKPLSVAGHDVGTVRVVRTTIVKHAVVGDNSFIQWLVVVLPCAFGCPLGIAYPALVPAEADHEVDGVIQVFDVDAAELDRRIISVPGSAEPYFNSDGLRPAAQRTFNLKLHASYGLLAERGPDSLIEPLAEPLLTEIRAAASTSSAPPPPAARSPSL